MGMQILLCLLNSVYDVSLPIGLWFHFLTSCTRAYSSLSMRGSLGLHEWQHIGLVHPCINTTTIAYPLAFDSTSKGFFKLGDVRIDSGLIFNFNASMTYYWLFLHWKLLSLLVMACNGGSIAENDAMNFHRNYASPTNILTCVNLVWFDHLMMASIIMRSILSFPLPIMYPKYNNGNWTNSHLLRFPSNWFLFRVSNTYMRCEICSSHVELKINIPSMYTITI